jgi:hypothetical protein
MSQTQFSVSQEVLDKIFAIAQTYPPHEGVTVEVLMSEHGFTDSNLVYVALNELQRQGKLVGRPLFYYTGDEHQKS